MQALLLAPNSLNNLAAIKKIPVELLANQPSECLLVVSAAENTNRQLLAISELFYAQKKDAAIAIFQQVKEDHYAICHQLMNQLNKKCIEHLADFFTEIEWLLHDNPVREFNYYANQIICLGELLSSCIISYYLNELDFKNSWIDARDIIRTDKQFANPQINWELSNEKIKKLYSNPNSMQMLVTQSNTGATDDNESTIYGKNEGTNAATVFNLFLKTIKQ